MLLSDPQAYQHVIGSLMINPLLFLEYQDLYPSDFDLTIARLCFVVIQKLYKAGAKKLSPIEVDQEFEKYENSAVIYKSNNGLDFLKSSYNMAKVENFEVYYTRVKKYSLLRRLRKEKYNISDFYREDKDIESPLQELELQQHFEEATIEGILNAVEGKYNIIRNDYLNGGKLKGDPADNIDELITNLQQTPSIGPPLEGQIFSTVCRGATEGCFFLKSASTSAGKTRTSVFDACRIAYPIKWSFEKQCFCEEVDYETGEIRQPRKVLFIVTEMDKEELQTIMLAFLSGVDEDHILTNRYELGELTRVRTAAKIMKKYSGYFIVEEISEPNLVNVEATIKKYAVMDNVKYCWFDYIHTTSSLVEQFAKSGLREEVCLMLLSNQLKQIAKDYNIFIFSATQVNVNAMMDDGAFKNETCIRGAKSVSDKCDMGYIMTRVTEKVWNSVLPQIKQAIREKNISPEILANPPTHILDIYKMRRGRYKNVRIWTYLHLGTGERKDLFITTPDNHPLENFTSLYSAYKEDPIAESELV